MSITSERLDYLLQAYSSGQYTEAERLELLALLDDEWDRIELGRTAPHVDWNRIYNNIIATPAILPVRRTNWKRRTVAASIILALGVASYFAFFNKSTTKPPIAKATDVEAPKGTRAMITLADGRTISINSLSTIDQGNITVTKTIDGQIVYAGLGNEVVFNTLSNPKGSKVIDLVLNDGSHVWLNAGSSVTYPIAFIGNERKVSITGEAYFEIAHDKSKPFTISKGDMDVQVLGTKFNVNAYDDESNIKVTLLEGSVNVLPGASAPATRLSPGMQAVLTTADSRLTTHSNVDTEAVLAWKNGIFDFAGADVEAVMKQLSRWYDVDIAYEGPRPVANFRGTIPRQENISQVLKMLEITKAVKFRIEGRKIIVSK